MYVCICNAVTEREIRQAVGLGVTTMKELREGLGVAGDCGKCGSCAKQILRDELASSCCGGLTLAQAT
jgi:bacterioferritin-associated ferredoxin